MISVGVGRQREYFVEKKVRAGVFTSVDELVDEALRQMEERERRSSHAREEIGAKLQAGWVSLQADRSVDGKSGMADLLKDLEDSDHESVSLDQL